MKQKWSILSSFHCFSFCNAISKEFQLLREFSHQILYLIIILSFLEFYVRIYLSFPKMKYCYLTQKRYATTASVCFYWICERHCAKKSSAHRLPAQRGPLVKDKIGWQAMGQVLYAWGLNWSFDTNSNSDRDIFMPHLGKDEIQYLAFKHVHCYFPNTTLSEAMKFALTKNV